MKKVFIIGLSFMITSVPCFAKIKGSIFIIDNITPIQTINSIYNELSKSKIDNLKLDAKKILFLHLMETYITKHILMIQIQNYM